MSDIPNHIKILYLMFLKQGYTAQQIKVDLNGELYDCSCEVCGAWGGFAHAANTRNEIMKFINDYEIIQKKRV